LGALQDFSQHLDAMTDLFSRYGGFLEQKEELLQRSAFGELEQLLPEEETLVIEMDHAERRRDELARFLCREKKIPEDSRLQQIVQTLPEKEGTQLMVKVARLMECLQDISFHHLNVQQMVSFQLRQIRVMEQTLHGDTRTNVYNVEGKNKPRKGNTQFDGNG